MKLISAETNSNRFRGGEIFSISQFFCLLSEIYMTSEFRSFYVFVFSLQVWRFLINPNGKEELCRLKQPRRASSKGSFYYWTSHPGEENFILYRRSGYKNENILKAAGFMDWNFFFVWRRDALIRILPAETDFQFSNFWSANSFWINQ